MARESPLLPQGDAREAALFFVVAALCFLAALAALSARATYGAAEAWTAQVEGELTVRLRGVDRRGAERARDIVAGTESVEQARLLSRDEVEVLLAPSFGTGGLPAGLPMPSILDVRADPADGEIVARIRRRLAEAGIEALVDDHADWAGDVRRMLGLLRVAALSTVGLLSATALAVIAFATHAALLARRDIVEVLHLSGANDRFISRLFERRFWLLGLQAGVVGALFALGSAALVLALASADPQRRGLLPQLNLDLVDLVILLVTPVVAAIAAKFAARVTVMRALKGTL